MSTCKGKKCKAVDGVGHSKECETAHEAAAAMQELTQELIDNTFMQMSELWMDKFEESGHKLVASFVAENKDGWAVQFLAEYQMAKESVEEQGFTMPVLVEGISVKLGESHED